MRVRLNENKEIVAQIRGGPEKEGGPLPLQAGGLPRHQMYLPGVPGPDRRPRLRGVLPLHALL